MLYTEPSRGSKGLHVLDPDLSLLAAEASLDIDNLISKRSTEEKAIRILANRLNNSIETNDADGHLHSLMDPPTQVVLGEAADVKTIADLLPKISKISEILSRENLTQNPVELQQAGDFCMALGMAVVAHRKSIRDLRPLHRFRK